MTAKRQRGNAAGGRGCLRGKSEIRHVCRGIPSNFKRAKEERYAFDRVFDDTASQEEVFQNTTKHLIDGVLNGLNATVFAYGATGLETC
jgi:hypothetical protein